MSDDYRVPARSDADVHGLAKAARSFFGVADAGYVDVLACLAKERIWTVTGEKRLIFDIKSDADLGSADGLTSFAKDAITISVKRSVRYDAFMGVGRARNTLAHEIGHAVMHQGPPMARLALGNLTPKWLRPFESAEHQAKIFAPAFLINDTIARELGSAEEISVYFGISLESAEIYFKQIEDARNRQENVERVLRTAREFRARHTPDSSKVHYIDERCPACGEKTLFPVGTKFMCHTCDNVTDRFQDGDLGQ